MSFDGFFYRSMYINNFGVFLLVPPLATTVAAAFSPEKSPQPGSVATHETPPPNIEVFFVEQFYNFFSNST